MAISETTKRTIIIVGTATALSYGADVLTFSLGRKALTFPKGKEALSLLAVGVATGLILDQITKWIEEGLKLPEEKALDALVGKEKEKIYAGSIKNQTPTQVQWAAGLSG